LHKINCNSAPAHIRRALARLFPGFRDALLFKNACIHMVSLIPWSQLRERPGVDCPDRDYHVSAATAPFMLHGSNSASDISASDIYESPTSSEAAGAGGCALRARPKSGANSPNLWQPDNAYSIGAPSVPYGAGNELVCPMSKPLLLMIPHRLGKDEAVRRLKTGLSGARTHFRHVLSIQEEIWTGDHLQFRVSALGQVATGTIEVTETSVRLEVMLPWLLAQLADKLQPLLRREGTSMLEKK
jgi:hypothetical protein